MTLSILPVMPFDGGSINMTETNSHVIRISGNLYLGVCIQIKPRYSIATVINVDSDNSTTTVVSQNVITDLNIGGYVETATAHNSIQMKMTRISDRKAMIMFRQTGLANGSASTLADWFVHVLEVGDDNIVRIISNQSVSVGKPVRPLEAMAMIGLDDNSMIFAKLNDRTTTTFDKLVFDPETGVITSTPMGTWVDPTTGYNHYERKFRVMDIPDSSAKILTITNASEAIASAHTYRVIAGFVFESSTETVEDIFKITTTEVSNLNVTFNTYIPINVNTGVFTNGVNFRYFTNGVFYDQAYIEGALGGDSYSTHSGVCNDDKIFFSLHSSASNAAYTSSEQKTLRVFKLHSESYARCSPNTIGAAARKGVLLPRIAHYRLNNMELHDGSIVIPGFTNTASQPGYYFLVIKPV